MVRTRTHGSIRSARVAPRRGRCAFLLGAGGALALIAAHAAANPPIFPPDNPWNQRITTAPVSPLSTAVMNSITSTYGNGRIHPDFGEAHASSGPIDLYGIPYNVVHGASTPAVSVVVNVYANQSDIAPAPIPANAVLEGDWQNGPRPGLNARGDSHLLVWDIDSNTAYEFYRCSRPGENADGNWHADQESVWHFSANSFRPLGWTSADAAGLSILAGLARPDEALPASQGGAGVITHAIRFTLRNAVILDQYIYPASHVANPGNTNAAVQPPMGSRFRLKASVDISAFTPQSRVVAQAMKDYGLILADNGSNFFFSGASISPDASNQPALTWDDNDIQDTVHGLKSLHFADFELVDLTPVVSNIAPAQGPAGTAISITGQNFSGAAGRLQVLFGLSPAGSFAIIDDAHLTAVAPAGSGTVDVRVQSGLTAGPDSENARSPIFGYGLSPVAAPDQFTYIAAAGVCCRGATCSATTPRASCTAAGTAGAAFFPGATACNSGSAATPCCHADYNKSGVLSVQDIFDFLSDWFNASPYANTGGDGSPGPITIQRIFDFLADWFAGC